MGFHDRAVDQIEAVARLRSQRVEDALPDAASGPPVEAIVGRRIRAVAFGQIPPRHPGAQYVEDCVHDLAIINPGTLSAPRHQRLKQRPFFIAQIESHDPPPGRVNHFPN